MLVALVVFLLNNYADIGPLLWPAPQIDQSKAGVALQTLDTLAVKGRAPNTGYSRDQFGDGWEENNGCDMRNAILARDLTNTVVNQECQVTSGVLHDPYTDKDIHFERGRTTSAEVQIDHVVALNDAWQKGAQALSYERRVSFANNPLNLLAVDGSQNQTKSASDAASWLPPHKAFRCQYVARQVAVKAAYELWVTKAEKQAIRRVLANCPAQPLPSR